jgi:hypothetical protein
LFSYLAPLLAGIVLGCNPVRQDRTITFSKDGDGVSFQHDADGVYVAGKDGGPPIKVFEPGRDIAAVSTPLWNPRDHRLLFTTAKPLNGEVRSAQSFADQNPAGALFSQRPVRYTCWLRAEPKDVEAPQPIALFEAECDHIGYVAANLAVRWHPDGERVIYVKEMQLGRHGLFEYELATKSSRPAFPYTARALIFDWTPDGAQLVCVVAGVENGKQPDGIWIGQPETDQWWHVEASEQLDQASNSALERLKATRPVWTKDGTRFAFVASKAKPNSEEPTRHVLRMGSLAERRTWIVADGTEPIRDLHWAPDGERLGLVRGGDPGSLHLVDKDRALSPALNRRPVRSFVGWSASGGQLAYTTPDKLPYADGKLWAFLLPPDPLARDGVLVADGAGDDPGREVFSGMRVTFPTWSPKEDKLSLWFTFSPTHRFLLSHLFVNGLRRGDPAAVFDVRTGAIGWMAVNGYEKAQIGHYHLLKREYAAALGRYEEAERELGPPKSPTVDEFARNLQSPRDLTLFHFHCLKKLGRDKEAQAKLELFQRTFVPEWPSERIASDWRWLLERADLWLALLRNFYAAEVFLSLDASGDARRYFETALRSTDGDVERLSGALALGQVLLLEGKHADYADITTSTILPLLLKIWKSSAADANRANLLGDPSADLLLLAVLAIAPLQSPEFIDGLPHASVDGWLPRWQALRERATDDATRLGLDLILYAASKSRGLDDDCRTIADRIEKNPRRGDLLPGEGIPDPALLLRQSLEKALPQLDALREVLSAR